MYASCELPTPYIIGKLTSPKDFSSTNKLPEQPMLNGLTNIIDVVCFLFLKSSFRYK